MRPYDGGHGADCEDCAIAARYQFARMQQRFWARLFQTARRAVRRATGRGRP